MYDSGEGTHKRGKEGFRGMGTSFPAAGRQKETGQGVRRADTALRPLSANSHVRGPCYQDLMFLKTWRMEILASPSCRHREWPAPWFLRNVTCGRHVTATRWKETNSEASSVHGAPWPVPSRPEPGGLTAIFCPLGARLDLFHNQNVKMTDETQHQGIVGHPDFPAGRTFTSKPTCTMLARVSVILSATIGIFITVF